MPRDRSDIEADITKLTGRSYSRGECIVCQKNIKEGSQKVINSYDICHGCYFEDADPQTQRLMFLLNNLETRIAYEVKTGYKP